MNAVLGLASGYSFKLLKPLVHSLKETGFDGEIILFVSNLSESTVRALKEKDVQLIFYQERYPYFIDDPELNKHLPEGLENKYLSPNSLRYILYEAFLKEFHSRYDWVLHTDTRDVYFQSNPFNYYKSTGIYCFLEDLSFRIKDNKHNTFWIKHGFGEEVFARMKDLPISCSGVTIGSVSFFQSYLKKMCDYIVQLPNAGGLDQGIHNYLIYTDQIDGVNLIKDDEGPVTTLTIFKPYKKIRFNKKGQLLNNHNEVLPVVHQYDRHLSLLWKFNKPGFWLKTTNIAKRKILLAIGRKFDD